MVTYFNGCCKVRRMLLYQSLALYKSLLLLLLLLLLLFVTFFNDAVTCAAEVEVLSGGLQTLGPLTLKVDRRRVKFVHDNPKSLKN